MSSANPNYEKDVDQALGNKEKSAVKSYSGYRFAWINSVARGFWDYEKMGRKTPELEEEIKSTTREIALAPEDLSYSPEQTEVLIDHDSLSYISDVNFDREGHAIVDAILIPRSIYE